MSETVGLLREDIKSKEGALLEERRSHQSRLDAIERERSTLQNKVSTLQAQLSAAPNPALVESMKRELRILKRLEYNADDVDTEFDPEIAGLEEENDLESVLVQKLRRAESELVSERMNKSAANSECEELKKALVEAEKSKDALEKLVSSLERDLERAIATPGSTTTTIPATSQEKPAEAGSSRSSSALEGILDPATGPSEGSATRVVSSTDETAASKNATEKAQDDHSVATIVMAQRDRLRARCEALEAERDSFKKELQGQVQASESLKVDNTKLYEKVRYLQNYGKRGGGPRPAVADRDLDLEALEQRYEASVDPFRQFSKAERQRKLNEMSPMERAVFIVAKTVLGTYPRTVVLKHEGK